MSLERAGCYVKNSLYNLLEVVKGRIGWIVLSALMVALAFVWLPPVVSRGVKVSFDLRSERAFVCSAYFKEAERGPFLHVDTRVPAGSSQVQFLIPVANVKALRIDYGARPGHVESGPVQVAGEREEVLDWKDFGVYNDIARRTIRADGWLSLDSEGRDPYVVFGKDLNMLAGRHFDFRGIMVRILLLLAAVVGIFWRTRPVESVRAAVFKGGVRPVSEWFDAICRRSYDGFRSLLPDRSFAIYMVVVILLAWGFELFNFTFTSDDDVVLCGGFSLDTWLKEGRWGMFLLDKLYGNNSVPLFPLAITLVLYSLTFVVIFDRLGRFGYFLFPVYVAFPVIYQSFSFSSLNPGIGIAFFLAALAVRLSGGGIAACCASVLLGAFSIGCYQIFVFFMAIVVVIRCMDRIDAAERFSMRALAASAVRGCCLVVLSYLVYKAIMCGFTHVTGVGETYVAKRYFDPPRTLADLRVWWPLALNHVGSLLSGVSHAFPTAMWVFPVLLAAAGGVIAAWTVFGRRPLAVRLVVFFGCLSLMALAFLPLAFNRRAMILDRIIVPLIPTALVGVLSFSARCLLRFRPGMVLGAGLCMACAFQFIWGINQMTFSNCLQNRYDVNLMTMVKARVEALPGVAMRRFGGRAVPLLVVGRSETDRRGAVIRKHFRNSGWPVWERDNVGRSLLVEPSRWPFALKTYTGTDYVLIDRSKISDDTMRFIENMPIWPLSGSVAWKDGCAIVKFSDFAPEPVLPARKTSRRLCRCVDVRINGFDELVYTDVRRDDLLHEYGKDGALAAASGGVGLSLRPYRTAEPYVILEFRTEAGRNSLLTLWSGHVRQECQFSLPEGSNVLRLRVPSEFLSIPLRLDLTSSAGAAVKILGVNVYADRKYTERLFELNSGLKDSPLSSNGGKM